MRGKRITIMLPPMLLGGWLREVQGVSPRCLTSLQGHPAGSKNGAAALLGGNGAVVPPRNTGEPHGG